MTFLTSLPNGPCQPGGQGGVTEPHLAGPGENLKLSGGGVPQVHHEGTGVRRPGGRRRRCGALRSWTRGGNHGASAGGRSEPDCTRAGRTSQHGTARHVRRLLGNGSGIHDRICVTVRRHDVLSGAWLIAPCGRHGRIAPCRPRLALTTFSGQGPRLEWAARRTEYQYLYSLWSDRAGLAGPTDLYGPLTRLVPRWPRDLITRMAMGTLTRLATTRGSVTLGRVRSTNLLSLNRLCW